MPINNALNNTALEDFLVTTATAGTTRTLTVSNTNNANAASAALVAVTTGGASAGDAYHRVSTTTTSWAFGVDNSVTSPTADPFVISQSTVLGTNNVMSVATSGEINYPLQPCFLSGNSANQNNITGDAVTYTVTFVNEVFDQNNDFDGTSTFTAPVTGRYLFATSLTFTGILVASFGNTIAFITSNATVITFYGRLFNIIETSDGGLGYSSSTIADMDAADTCSVRIQFSGTARVVDVVGNGSFRQTTFSGYLIA